MEIVLRYNLTTEQGIKDAEKAQEMLQNQFNKVTVTPDGYSHVIIKATN